MDGVIISTPSQAARIADGMPRRHLFQAPDSPPCLLRRAPSSRATVRRDAPCVGPVKCPGAGGQVLQGCGQVSADCGEGQTPRPDMLTIATISSRKPTFTHAGSRRWSFGFDFGGELGV